MSLKISKNWLRGNSNLKYSSGVNSYLNLFPYLNKKFVYRHFHFKNKGILWRVGAYFVRQARTGLHRVEVNFMHGF